MEPVNENDLYIYLYTRPDVPACMCVCGGGGAVGACSGCMVRSSNLSLQVITVLSIVFQWQSCSSGRRQICVHKCKYIRAVMFYLPDSLQEYYYYYYAIMLFSMSNAKEEISIFSKFFFDQRKINRSMYL